MAGTPFLFGTLDRTPPLAHRNGSSIGYHPRVARRTPDVVDVLAIGRYDDQRDHSQFLGRVDGFARVGAGIESITRDGTSGVGAVDGLNAS